MCSRVDIGVDAQRHARDLAMSSGARLQQLQFRLRFHIELQDAVLQAEIDLFFRLADAGEDDLVRAHPDLESSQQFAAGDDVKARSHSLEQVENCQAGVGLHRIAGEVREACEAGIEFLEVPLEGGLAIQV